MSFNVYKSSAGSGKTFTLVKEYIKLAIQRPDQFRHILAITFTNKAANEMKERVIRYLTELSGQPIDKTTVSYNFLLPELIESSKLTEKEISSKALMALDSILHNYSDFAIGTIDSFVHRIIRSFAHDLKIPMNFEVEMDTDKLLTEAIDLLLNKAGSDELLTKILVEFTEAKTDDEKSWHIETDLQLFARQLFKEDNLLHIEKIRNLGIKDFLEIRKKLGSLISMFENAIIKIATEAFNLITKHNIPIDAFYRGNTGIGKYFENLSKGNIDKIKPNSYVTETLEQNKWYAGKASPADKEGIDAIKNELGEAYLKINELKEKHYKNYVLYTLIHSNIYPVAVLNEIEKVIEEIKKEDNILPISEFNRRISKIVVSQPVPFIYERLGEKYQDYLIDEFQDTSTLQWLNLLPLIENSLSYNYFNMLVGDGKQAIYRWRGGDVEQFSMLPELPKEITDEFSKERASAIKRQYEEFTLSSNFRSKEEIINFNNGFFSYAAELSSDYIKSIFKSCEQTIKPGNTGGYVQIDFINPNDFADLSYDEITLNKINEIINKLKEQNFSYRDVAILCRSNNEASIIARELITLGIQVISEESLLIAGSKNIGFLLALATFVATNTDDDIAKYHILHYLISNKMVFDNDIYALCMVLRKNNKGRDNSIDTGLFIKYLQQNNFLLDLNLLTSLPVFDFFEEMLSVFAINRNSDPNVRFFLDAVLEFSSEKKNNVSQFLDWWDEQKDKRSIIIPPGIDAIRIMTIHKAKGLEFPVVIYPYATDRIRNTNDKLWVNTDIPEIPELKSSLISNNEKLKETVHSVLYNSEKDKSFLDLLNVLYVALTRPSERLYILSKTPSDKISEPKSIPDFLASYLQSIGKYDRNNSQYSFGAQEINKQECGQKKEDELNLTLKPYPVKNRSQAVHLKKRATDIWDVENPQRNSDWGNLIHYALSLIDHTGNIDNIIEGLLLNGMLLNEQVKEITEKITGILSEPLINPYFQPGCIIKTEAEILLKDGSVIRPDRVNIDGDKIIIFDYKTGEEKDKHKEQILSYATALHEMGYSDIKNILVYVDLNKVVTV